MSDLNFQNLSTVQSKLQAQPATVASATSVGGSVATFITFITGTTSIATITPPVTGQHMLVLIYTDSNPGGVTTGGNILVATDPAQYAPVLLFYDPIQAKYYSGKLAVG